jgi:hypothetical protein
MRGGLAVRQHSAGSAVVTHGCFPAPRSVSPIPPGIKSSPVQQHRPASWALEG